MWLLRLEERRLRRDPRALPVPEEANRNAGGDGLFTSALNSLVF